MDINGFLDPHYMKPLELPAKVHVNGRTTNLFSISNLDEVNGGRVGVCQKVPLSKHIAIGAKLRFRASQAFFARQYLYNEAQSRCAAREQQFQKIGGEGKDMCVSAPGPWRSRADCLEGKLHPDPSASGEHGTATDSWVQLDASPESLKAGELEKELLKKQEDENLYGLEEFPHAHLKIVDVPGGKKALMFNCCQYATDTDLETANRNCKCSPIKLSEEDSIAIS